MHLNTGIVAVAVAGMSEAEFLMAARDCLTDREAFWRQQMTRAGLKFVPCGNNSRGHPTIESTVFLPHKELKNNN
jgi:hypothetical protein